MWTEKNNFPQFPLISFPKKSVQSEQFVLIKKYFVFIKKIREATRRNAKATVGNVVTLQ